MTKTSEELTEDWLNNKLQAGSFWFVETEDSNPEPMVVDMDGDFNDYEGNYYTPGAYLLTCIKDALGESEDDIERLYK